MSRITYTVERFSAAHMDVIQKVNQICATYRQQGFNLTLRQVYYQFVARGWIPNKDTEYKRLGSIITRGRRAGEIDWSYIEDRTRNVRGGDGSMTDPSQTISPYYFAASLWEGQPRRVEVWVEKDALVDIVGRACAALRVPYFSCRGYTSDSEIWAAAQRLEGYLDEDGVEGVTVLHLGDHDPSGIDMSRDITDRLSLFMSGDGYGFVDRAPDEAASETYDFDDAGVRAVVKRIALNMPQIEEYDPPPNPAKVTDSRAVNYILNHGTESWELDALEPSVLRDLIERNIYTEIVDDDAWEGRRRFEAEKRGTLTAIKEHYPRIIEFLGDNGLLPEPTVEDDESE